MIPGDAQIEQEMAAFPGLGKMQAINRIRQRARLMEDRRRNSRAHVIFAAPPVLTVVYAEPGSVK